jgi:hypothetical protein
LLCHERLSALLELANAPKVDLTPENVFLLQQMLDMAIDQQEDCPVSPSLPVSANVVDL